jgi:hypothetical protein
MIDKMEERWKWKYDNTENGRKEYKKLNNELRRTTDKAREEWMESQCLEIEEFENNGRMDKMYRTTKSLTKKELRKISKKGIMDKKGKITSDVEDMMERLYRRTILLE